MIASELTDSMKQQEEDCENRCASYYVTENDEGEYIITVKASDGEFTDFQNVRVKVSSKILAVPKAYSLYEFTGEKTKWLSNEEAAFFDGKESLLPDPGAEYNYIWLDSYIKQTDGSRQNEQATDEFLKEKCIVKFSDFVKPCEDAGSILDIKKPVTLNPIVYANTGRKPVFSFDAEQKTDDDGEYYSHNITLGVKLISEEQSQESVESTDIKVKECLPYEVSTSSTEYPDLTQTYPFMYARKSNQAGYDTATVEQLDNPSSLDFKGAHTGQSSQKIGCCTKEGIREDTNKVCFEYSTRMLKDDLEANSFNAVNVLKTKLVKDSTAGDGSLQVLDSVQPTLKTCDTSPCEITFRQYCGLRGNACSGNIKWEIVNS